jgi:hypothetical protein
MMRMKTAMINRTVATVGLTALLWLLCTLTIPGPLHAAVYFDSDFETCNVGTGNDFPCEGWDDFGIEFINAPNHNKIEVTNTSSFTGSKSVNGTWVNVNCSLEHPSLYHTIPQNQSMFARFGARRSSDFQMSFNNITKLVRWRGGNQGGYPVVSVWMQSFRYIVGIEGGWGMGSVNYVGGPPVSTTAWDQVEIEVKFNTPEVSDGLVRLWVNGVLYIERLNLQLRGPTPTSVNAQGLTNSSNYLFDTAQIFVQCGKGNVWYDRFAVGNTRIGPVSVGGDITPPARPTLYPIP